MSLKYLPALAFLFSGWNAAAQYAPQAPLPGNTGIAQNDTRIADWASGCTVQRGWINIADKSLGEATLGTVNDAIGMPGNGVLSLGDSGVAVLTFSYPVYNGAGADFAVFENGFADPQNNAMAYLELAFVEVSSDGVNFFRFPASSEMQDSVQIDNFSYSDATKYNNLAGKYISGYGTPFDLEELKDTPGLDVNHITHVRLVDVIGSIDPQYGSLDKDGHIINDPYPSPYASAGFDLSGIAVINSQKPPSTGISGIAGPLPVKVYPNPASDDVHITCEGSGNVSYQVTALDGVATDQGILTGNGSISLAGKAAGVYLLHLRQGEKTATCKIIKQ